MPFVHLDMKDSIIIRSILYGFLRVIMRAGIHVFFRSVVVKNRHRLKDMDGPLIVVVNHPSTLMDVLVPGTYIPRVLFYLANYGLFKNPISRWILLNTYGIPVKRREDVAEGESRDNQAAFEQSFEYLEKGRALFIAAEGVSWMNRFIRPLKTGAARIALEAEGRNDGGLKMRIVPVGLSYTAPHLFRSQVVLSVGAPVEVSQWLENWKTEPEATVEQLTTHLEQQLRQLTLDALDETGEVLLTQIETLLQNEEPLSAEAAFDRSRELLDRHILQDEELKALTNDYFSIINTLKVDDWGVRNKAGVGDYVMLLLGSPIFLVAMIFWWLPLALPAWLNRRLNLYIGYSSTVKLLTGMFVTFPLAWWAIVHLTGATGWWRPALLLVILGLGWWAEQFLDAYGRVINHGAVQRLQPKVLEQLKHKREYLIGKILNQFTGQEV